MLYECLFVIFIGGSFSFSGVPSYIFDLKPLRGAFLIYRVRFIEVINVEKTGFLQNIHVLLESHNFMNTYLLTETAKYFSKIGLEHIARADVP